MLGNYTGVERISMVYSFCLVEMIFFTAQFFAHVKHIKNMSEKLVFAKKQVFEQFFEQKT